MTIARAHDPPVGSQFKPNECFRFQAKQSVYKDGSETVTAHILKRRILVKLGMPMSSSSKILDDDEGAASSTKTKVLHVLDGDHEVFI